MSNNPHVWAMIAILSCISLLGCKESERDSENKKRSKENYELAQKYKDLKKCESTILIEIGDVTLISSRDQGLSWRDMSGKKTESYLPNMPSIPNPDHPLYDCAIEKIKNVWAVSSPIGVGVINSNNNTYNIETSYQRFKNSYEKAKQDNAIQILPSGIEKFMQSENDEGYVLPAHIANTGNGEPIYIYCENLESNREERWSGSCATTFFITTQVILSHGFDRTKVSESQYIQEIKKIREYFESLEAVSDDNRIDSITQQEECKEDNITIQIDGIRLSTQRYGTTLRLISGEEISDLHKRCDTHFMGDVQSMRWPHMALSSVSSSKNSKTYYRRYKEQIEVAKAEGKIEIVSVGIQKINLGASELYVLLHESVATENNEPVLFFCSDIEENRENFLTQRCDTSYYHPIGLIVWYSKTRVNYPAYDFISMDKDVQKKISEIASEDSKIKTPSNGDAP